MESGLGGPARPAARAAVRSIANWWWLWLVFGAFWVIVGLVILQFDQASVNTVGILVGAIFLATAAQNFMIIGFVEGGIRWFYGIFGALFVIAGSSR